MCVIYEKTMEKLSAADAFLFNFFLKKNMKGKERKDRKKDPIHRGNPNFLFCKDIKLKRHRGILTLLPRRLGIL